MELTLSDESLNRYGTRILTKGLSLGNFLKNPVMFYNHDRSRLPIGKWENVKKVDGKLVATPTFDIGDEFAKEVKRKFEDGYLNSASIGILVLGTSNEPELMLQGQSLPTITKCELLEASVVDVPANANAVKLYHKADNGELLELSFEDFSKIDFDMENKKLLELEVKIDALQTKLDSLQGLLEEQKQKPTLKAKASEIVEALRAEARKPDATLEKLNAHPERTYADWWLLDTGFLRELKSKHPDKYAELQLK
ncbi:MAG: hypothetical protein Fur0027_14490 [Raineya sp.]